MFKRKSAATPVRSKSPPLLEKRQYVASPRFYEILDYFAEKLNVPLQFSTFMKKRYSKDQISEPQDFEHLIHSESEQDAEAALKTLSSKIPGTYKNLAKQFPNIKGNRKSQAMGTVVIRDVPDEYIHSSETSEIIPSVETVEKSAAIKIYFENYFYGVLKKPSGRMTRRLLLENELEKMTISEQDKQWIRQELLDLESDYMRLLRKRIAISSFNIVKTIGHGAFGVVKLVREKSSGKLYAMKMMRKADMLKKGQEGHVRAERDILTAAAETAQWIVKLIYSFQDADNLYLVMEYMAGGDLLNLLIEKDTFEEDFAKFYVAEMVLAIEEAHRLGYIHRDVKPDNFLFDSDGHIKLSDFGLATGFHWSHDSAYYEQQRKDLLHKTGIDIETDTLTRMMGKKHRSARWSEDWSDELGDDKVPNTRILTWRDNHRRNLAFSVVGTNNYMAPEVLRNTGYDSRCDWWSLGVIIFEMLYGFPPFCSKSRLATRQKIVNWQQTLRFPARPHLSHEAQDLIKRLICEKEDRLCSSPYAASTRPNSLYAANRRPAMLGADDASEIKAHPWFKGIDWANLHNVIPPFRPKLKNEIDTRYFEEIVDDNPLAPPEGEVERKPKDPLLRDKQHGNIVLNTRMQKAFAGYTFRGLPLERLRGGMVERIKQRAAGKEQRLRSRAMSL